MADNFLHTHNDEPVVRDFPGREALVRQVAVEIARCNPPQVFGVHGDWGAGKTSFLCAVEKVITGRCRKLADNAAVPPDPVFKDTSVVWFEAWRYQHEPAPVIALLHEMCSQLSLAAKGVNKIKKLAFAGFRGLINMVKKIEFWPSVGGVSVGKMEIESPFSTIQAAGEEWEADHFAAPLTTERVRELLDETIKQLLGWSPGKKVRVLIIIDDLDRCAPASAYRLLEGIKIYLNLQSCVFLLGINQREIVRAIGEAKAGDKPVADQEQRRLLLREAETRGAEYLEKLCSVIWKLPLPPAGIRGELLRPLLRPMRLDGGVMKPSDEFPLSDLLVAEICAVIERHDCLPANPRKIKAFANALRQIAPLGLGGAVPATGTDLPIAVTEAEALVAAASIYAFHPKLLQYLQAHRLFFADLLRWSRTGAQGNLLHDALAEMELLHHPAVQAATSAGVGPERFADPSYGAIFRIQRLLNEAAQPPDPFYDQLQPYLTLPSRNNASFATP
jgi:hypothetical protein